MTYSAQYEATAVSVPASQDLRKELARTAQAAAEFEGRHLAFTTAQDVLLALVELNALAGEGQDPNMREQDYGLLANGVLLWTLLSEVKGWPQRRINAQIDLADKLNGEARVKIDGVLKRMTEIAPELRSRALDSIMQSQPEYLHYAQTLFAKAAHIPNTPEDRTKLANLQATTKDALKSILEGLQTLRADFGGPQPVGIGAIYKHATANTSVKLREKAQKLLEEMLATQATTAVTHVNTVLKANTEAAKLQGYSSVKEAFADTEDVPISVQDALIEAIKSYKGFFHEYHALKGKVLGVKGKLGFYDLVLNNPSLVEAPMTLPDALTLIIDDVIANVNPDYANRLKVLFDDGYVDSHEKAGKGPGWRTLFMKAMRPLMILQVAPMGLDSRDIENTAHEAGHAIHFLRMFENQLAIYRGIQTPTLEIPSCFFEELVSQKLLEMARESGNEELVFTLLSRRLDMQVRAVARQTMFYQFDNWMYERVQNPDSLDITVEEMQSNFTRIVQEYAGEHVEIPQKINYWIYFCQTHSAQPFGNIAYPFGELIVTQMVKRFKAGLISQAQLDQFLSAGKSQSIESSIKILGIDINDSNLWNESLEEMKKLQDEVVALGKKLGKIK